ncbi:PIR Superfamily Protein [Plasmodium ovale curtisi]|uniref:PIR Superfamily Protein n=1 Tax=Plasmodium ovale curtisi TaxID=864141 RepID=A0A1A8WSP0_PLAOA|nr:PIR Superfamily Protein [Plasmodium ovale curtisi]
MGTKNCELSSEKYYSNFDNVEITETSKSFCDLGENTLSGENLFNKYPQIKEFCYKVASNLENLKNKKQETSLDTKEYCTYLQLWLQDHVINTVESKSTIICIYALHAMWEKVRNTLGDSIKNLCIMELPQVGTVYREKWKKMHDYNKNYNEVECAFQDDNDCKENCREDYCKYIIDVINIYNEFEQVCNGTSKSICPEYWHKFKESYEVASKIETQCKEVYEKLGLYKVNKYFGEEGVEKYIEQYELPHTFSFIEKLVGYSVKNIISQTIYYSKYILLPIILILLFYFFMKKLSLFGSKVSPRVDDLRKMWRNVQGVTNPATLLNPPKPPMGGNKMGLPYMPK